MNAYELADGIENCTTDPLHKEVATMLRQQAHRITELEKDNKEHFEDEPQAEELYEIIESNKEVSSKPVAWRYWGFNILNEPAWVYSDEWNKYYPLMGIENLYTHPVKQLSEEEIHKIAQEHFHAGLGINPLDFARAIIKEITE